MYIIYARTVEPAIICDTDILPELETECIYKVVGMYAASSDGSVLLVLLLVPDDVRSRKETTGPSSPPLLLLLLLYSRMTLSLSRFGWWYNVVAVRTDGQIRSSHPPPREFISVAYARLVCAGSIYIQT